MIPVDIDNFIFEELSIYNYSKCIRIKGILHEKLPKELGNCSYLKIVEIHKRNIVDISALSNCHYLEELYLRGNNIEDISSLLKCKNLKVISLYDNPNFRVPFNLYKLKFDILS